LYVEYVEYVEFNTSRGKSWPMKKQDWISSLF
jgi:hypothetical protein